VRNSLLFTGVRTHSFSSLEHVVALPQVIVHRKARLTKVVLDRGVIIPEGLVIGEDPGEDVKWFRRSEGGIVLVTQEMLDARAAKLG
jgi:glucose-1-phosphate adenylyltransferase